MRLPIQITPSKPRLHVSVSIALMGLSANIVQAGSHFLDLDLNALTNLPITASSLLAESELTSSSSVSILEPKDWQQRGDTSTYGAIGRSTNVMILPGAIGHSIQMRGYAGTLSPRGSATLVDGVPMNSLQYGTTVYTFNNLQLGVLDRIEIVRGPGSTKYGSDAFHSAIAYQTFTENKALVEFSVEIGEQGLYQSHAKFSQPLNDNWVFNAALAGSGQDDQQLRQIYHDPLLGIQTRNYPQEVDDKTALLKLHNGNSDSDLALTFSYLENQEDHPTLSGFGSRQDTPTLVLGNYDRSGQTTDSSIFKLDIAYSLSSSSQIKLASYYRESDSEFYLNAIDDVSSQRLSERYSLDEERKGLSITLNQQLKVLNSEFALSIGRSEQTVNRFDRRIISAETYALVSPSSSIRSPEFSKQAINDLTLEIKTYLLDDHLIFTYGARIDRYPEFGKQTSPRLSATYKLDENSALKFIYGNAFRAPVIGEKSGLSNVSGTPDLSPEEIDSYELVYMKRSEQWQLELVYYQSRFEKGIAIAPSSGGSKPFAYVNFSEQESEGVEASFEYSTGKWRFAANAALVDSNNLTSGEQHSAYPGWLSNFEIAYQLNDKISLQATNQWFGDYSLGDNVTASDPTPKANTYQRTDLHLEVELGPKWQAWLNVRNVFDKNNAYPSIFNGENGIPDIGLGFSLGTAYQF